MGRPHSNCSSRSGRTPSPTSRRPCNSCCAPKPRSGRFKWRSEQRGGGGGGGAARRAIWRPFRSRAGHRKESVRDPASRGTTAEQKAQEIDDALKKLDELASREEDLAQQQRNGQQTAEQKWQQEMLQREAAAAPAADGATARPATASRANRDNKGNRDKPSANGVGRAIRTIRAQAGQADRWSRRAVSRQTGAAVRMARNAGQRRGSGRR